MPLLPPDYSDLESNFIDYGEEQNNNHGTDPGPSIEQFEIDDDDTFAEERDGFLVRASIMTKKLANNFNTRVIHKVTRIIDPIYEGYKYFNMHYERSILKIGNPLVVKRLVYVIFIMGCMFMITKYNTNDAVSGGSGGAFSNGRFYDISKMSVSTRDFIDKNSMKTNLEYLSSMPHIAGSKGDLALAKYIESYMSNNGLKVIDFNELHSFTNYPVASSSYLKLSDGSFEATLSEMGKTEMEDLAYNPNSLSMNSEIEAKYVYGNFGSREDFKRLKEAKVALKGNLLLVKYGGSVPEANKVKLAQEFEMSGVIFVSPKIKINGEENNSIIQKFNVGLTRTSPGDVLTPGWPSGDGFVTKVPWSKSELTPKIPSVPISWKDGQKLMSKLEKGAKFDDLSSGDGLGPKVKMMIKHEERPSHQIWNVVGSIPGRDQLEKGIIIGAARDSSCSGTIGSNTGTTVMLEMLKVFTSLQRHYNWSPTRSVYFLSFDGTQYNLAGAGEWVESKIEELKNQGYAYIDLSDAVAGDRLSIKSHPFMHEVVRDALKLVDHMVDDDTGEKIDGNLYDYYKKTNNNNDHIRYNMLSSKNYIPFINSANMPSMEIKFTGQEYPENSCYDNFENFEKSNIDKYMNKHHQLVELLTIIALKLAESPIIPFNFNDFTSRLGDYFLDLQRYVQHHVEVQGSDLIPVFDVRGLSQSIREMRDAGKNFHNWCNSWKTFLAESGELEPSPLAMSRWKWNDNMVKFNGQFLSPDTEPKRPGYRNILFGVSYDAPSNDDNEFEWNTFPAIRNYIDRSEYEHAQQEIHHLANTLQTAARAFLIY